MAATDPNRKTAPPSPADRWRRLALRVYVNAIIGIGSLAVLHSLSTLTQIPHPVQWLLFAGAGLLAGAFTMKVSSVSAVVSVTDTFFITSTLLFGPAAGTIAVACDSLMVCWRRGYRRERIAFNTAEVALSLWAAGQLFFLISGTRPLIDSGLSIRALPMWVFVLSGVYFALNSGLMAIAIGL